MSKQNMKNQTNPSSDPQGSQVDKSTGAKFSKQQRMSSENSASMERMETFPKPNTFPKKWDMSSFNNK